MLVSEKGAVTIALAVMMMSMLTVIGITISTLMLQQVRMSAQAGQSVIAFYAADAGAERCLYELRKNEAVSCPFSDVPLDFSTDAMYTTTYNGSNQIISTGRFKDASRKLELAW